MKAEPAAHTEPELSTGDIGRRAASGVVLLTGKGIFAQALGLLSTIVVTRLLLPSQLGLFAIAVDDRELSGDAQWRSGNGQCAHPAPYRTRAR